MRVTRFSALWLIFSLISANFLLPWSAGLQPAAAQASKAGSSTGASSGTATTGGDILDESIISDDDIGDLADDVVALEYRKTYQDYIDEKLLTLPAASSSGSGEKCINKLDTSEQLSASAILFSPPAVRTVGFDAAPPFIHGCFFLDGSGLYHSFKYYHSSEAEAEDKYYVAEFTKDDTAKVYGGCLEASTTCDKDDQLTYDLFSSSLGPLKFTSVGAGGISRSSIGETYELINAWSIVGPTTKYRLLTDTTNAIVYKIINIEDTSTKEYSDAFSPPDFMRPGFNAQRAHKVAGGVNNYQEDYISRVNGLSANERRLGEINITGTAAENTFKSLLINSKFGRLIGNNKERLTTSEKLVSVDTKSTNLHQDFLLVEGEKGSNPKKPPQLVISGPRLRINSATERNDLIFDLVAVVKSENAIALRAIAARANNYFLFKINDPSKLNKDQSDFFKNEGIDPDVMYIAIDIMGNIGFLVDDKSKAGGIFGTNKDRFDRSADDNLIAIGQFSAQPGTISNNNTGGPLQINLEEYRWLITKRTYNNPDKNSTTVGCSQSNNSLLVNFGQENTAYDTLAGLIPNHGYLNCLATHKAADEDDAKSSWIAVWNLKVHKLDQFKNDECTNAFFKGGGFFGNVMGSFFCGLIGTMTGWAASAAGFSIDLVIDALGLQSS